MASTSRSMNPHQVTRERKAIHEKQKEQMLSLNTVLHRRVSE
jgi:hypothetical protein